VRKGELSKTANLIKRHRDLSDFLTEKIGMQHRPITTINNNPEFTEAVAYMLN